MLSPNAPGLPMSVPHELRAWAAVRVEALVTAQTHAHRLARRCIERGTARGRLAGGVRQAGNWPDEDESSGRRLSFLLSGRQSEDGEEEAEDPTGLTAHIAQARTALAHGPKPVDDATISVLTEVALFSPGNIALRAIWRLVSEAEGVEDLDLFEAAAVLANGLRSLFNRPDAIKLVERS